MANFSSVDWFKVMGVVAEVQAEVKALQDATTSAEKAAAIGKLAETAVSAAEAFSGKDLVNDDAFKRLVADVLSVVADVDALKPTA